MIEMGVGDQDSRHRPLLLGERFQHALGLVAWIEHDRVGAALERRQIAVRAIPAQRQLGDPQRLLGHEPACPCCFWYRRHVHRSVHIPIIQNMANIHTANTS